MTRFLHKATFRFWMILLFFSASTFSSDKADLHLVSQAEDYTLYENASAGASPDLVAFRLVGTLPYSPLEVATAMLDRDHRLLWMRDVKELRTIRFPKPGSVVEYSVVKTPSFLIKNRDFVTETSVEVDRPKNTIRILTKSVVAPETPSTSYVRADLVKGNYLLEPGPQPGTTRLTADLDVDPKGSVPHWIVNHFQKNWPVGMFRSLNAFLRAKIAKLPHDLQPLFEEIKTPSHPS
jgi:hypothetical protein